jgi:type II secretory pathway pseudopilin PulG
MMYDLDLTVVLTAAGIVVLAAVYVWSKNPDRQRRAWQLLKLLLRR